MSEIPVAKEDFSQREAELQQTISNLKLLNEKLILRNDETSKENDSLIKRLTKMELETTDSSEAVPQSEAVKTMKEKYENLLTKAKAMLFERQKTIQQQEIQIEALKAQVESLKEVAMITKEMLNIRNLENSNWEAKFETIDIKFKAQAERNNLMEQKMKLSEKLNGDLKTEYLAQKKTFNLLKDQYKTKIATLEKELAGYKNQPNGVH